MARFCTKCGSELKSDSRFCTRCGTPVEDPASPNPDSGSSGNQQADVSVREIQDWKAKRRRNKLIPIAIGIGVVLVALFFFFRNNGPGKDQVQKDLAVYLNVPKNVAEHLSVKSVKIDETFLDASKVNADITSTVTLESEDVRKIQSYKLNYTKIGDSTWVCNEILPFNEGAWKAEAVHGVSANTIKRSLNGAKVNADRKNSPVLRERDIAEVKIDKQDTDLKIGTDVVQFTYVIKSDIATLEQKVHAAYHFERDHWQLDSMKIDEKQHIVFNKGYEFRRTEEELKAEIFKSPITWRTNYGTQTIGINNDTLRNFKKLPEAFEWKSGTVTQRCTFDLVKRLVTFKVDADVVYAHTPSGWQVTGVNYTPRVQNINIKGVWTGHFTVWRGRPSLTLTISGQDENNALTVTSSFGASASMPYLNTASYTMVGSIEKETLVVRFRRGTWINRPFGEIMYDFTGVLLVDQDKIADRNESFSVWLTQKN